MRRARQRSILREQRRARRIAGAAGVAVLLAPAGAGAATFSVTTNADAGAGSLRAAVLSANGAAGDDEVTFTAGLGPIRLTTGEIPITGADDLTITGPGRDQLTISGDANNNSTADAGDSRIFNSTATDDATVIISGVTLTRGFAGAANPGGAVNVDDSGSGAATLRLTDAAVTQSRAEDGGGIASLGELIVTNSVISGNTADGSGGGVGTQEAEMLLDRVTLTGNTAVDGGGGAVTSGSGSGIEVRDSTVSGNKSTDPNSTGGGLQVQFGGLEVRRSTVTDNQAPVGGGLAGYTAKYGSGVFDSTVSGNTATDAGGGIVLLPIKYEARINQSTVSGNQAPRGAGAVVGTGGGGALTVERSTIRDNTANGPDSSGGGLAFATTGGHARVVDSTLTGNTAVTGGGIAVGLGGPVFKYQDGEKRGSLDLDNSTISGNTGGGVFLNSYNSEPPVVRRAADVGMSSTIVANNGGPDADRIDDATGGGLAAQFSLIEAPSGDAIASSTALITGQDPQLGGLADNGGPTQTMLPAGTSPALDQGRSGAQNTTDQRGQTRLVDTALPNPAGGGDGTDIGAVELPADAVVIPPAPSPSPAPAAPTFAVTAGATPIAPGTPLLPASLTPLTCAVTIVKMTGCDVAIRAAAPVKVSKKTTVPAGALLAEAQTTASEGVATLSGKARLTADGRAVLRKRPIGIDARAVGVAAIGAGNALTTAGNVHLLAGPRVTFKLRKGSRLAKSVRTQLGALGKLLTGAKTIAVSATGPSKKKAAKLAKAGGAALTAGGAKAAPTTKGKKSKKRRLKVTFTL